MCSRKTQEASVGGGGGGDIKEEEETGQWLCRVGLLIPCWVWSLLWVYNMVWGLWKHVTDGSVESYYFSHICLISQFSSASALSRSQNCRTARTTNSSLNKKNAFSPPYHFILLLMQCVYVCVCERETWRERESGVMPLLCEGEIETICGNILLLYICFLLLTPSLILRQSLDRRGVWGRIDDWVSAVSTVHLKLSPNCWSAVPQYKIKSSKLEIKKKTEAEMGKIVKEMRVGQVNIWGNSHWVGTYREKCKPFNNMSLPTVYSTWCILKTRSSCLSDHE